MKTNNGLSNVLKRSSGRLYEIPLLIVFGLIILAFGIPAFTKGGFLGFIYVILKTILVVAVVWGLIALYEFSTNKWPVVEVIFSYIIGMSVRFIIGASICLIPDGFLYVLFPNNGLLFAIVISIEAVIVLAISYLLTYNSRNPQTPVNK